jgi:hypothetical protein
MPSAVRRFPEIQARSLERERYDLPGEFEGRRNVAVVAFRREQQQMVDTWLPFLLTLEADHDDLRVYEIPTISQRWGPARWFIDGGMTAGIADREARARTLTTYTDVGRVQRALGLRDDATIATVLTDRDGRITWMATGAFTEEAGKDLSTALATEPR